MEGGMVTSEPAKPANAMPSPANVSQLAAVSEDVGEAEPEGG